MPDSAAPKSNKSISSASCFSSWGNLNFSLLQNLLVNNILTCKISLSMINYFNLQNLLVNCSNLQNLLVNLTRNLLLLVHGGKPGPDKPHGPEMLQTHISSTPWAWPCRVANTYDQTQPSFLSPVSINSQFKVLNNIYIENVDEYRTWWPGSGWTPLGGCRKCRIGGNGGRRIGWKLVGGGLGGRRTSGRG